VLRFAALGTTEQGDSGTQFRVDYLKLSGAIGFYHPDWVAVQQTDVGEINWIIETKGRVWEGTEQKDAAMKHWCDQVSQLTKQHWRYARINQTDFDAIDANSLETLVSSGLATAKLFDDA
jgi:type III restriction enzyme